MDDELIDDILDEVEELATRMSDEELARLLEGRAHALSPGAPRRAAWLSHAGERWEMGGDFARAKTCYEEAQQDGGDTFLDPRADLVNVLLELGETSRADELVEELRDDAKSGLVDEFTHERVGETLEMHGRPEEALRWFNSGLTYAQRDDPDVVDLGCLNGHFRVRRALGLPYDRYDVLCAERRLDHTADLEDTQRLLDAPPDTGAAMMTVLYWPEKDFDVVLERWPALVEDYGSDHEEHRRMVERRLRGLSAHRGQVVVGVGDFADYLAFAEGQSENAVEHSTRAAYAAHLGYLGRVVAWPPGRNDRCWCGSGRKYKKCCGTLRFADNGATL